MRREEEKPKSLKFYLFLVGILAVAYIVITAVLAIRNPKTEPETATTPVSVTESSGSSEVKDQTDDPKENESSGDRVGIEQTEVPESVADITVTDDYGRGKEQYTKMEAQDMFTKVNVSVTNLGDLERLVGAGVDSVKSYLNIYASRNGIDALTCTVLDHVYVGFQAERIEIYMQFDDEEGSLVTVIFEPANASHSSHVDVLPCPYTLEEIQERVWL